MEAQSTAGTERLSPRMAVVAVGLWLVWTVVTWLLEGRARTALRPAAVEEGVRFVLLAHLLIGVVGGAFVMRRLRGAGIGLTEMGVHSPVRSAWSIPAAIVLGIGAMLVVDLPTSDPNAVLNALASSIAAAAAEVVVCWAVIGGVAEALTKQRGVLASRLVHLVVSSVAYAAYHVAHSPPYAEPVHLVVLAVVGLGTGLFFLTTRDVYGTVILHASLAVYGVLEAVREVGQLDALGEPNPVAWSAAAGALVLLVAVDRWLIRNAPGPATTSG